MELNRIVCLFTNLHRPKKDGFTDELLPICSSRSQCHGLQRRRRRRVPTHSALSSVDHLTSWTAIISGQGKCHRSPRSSYPPSSSSRSTSSDAICNPSFAWPRPILRLIASVSCFDLRSISQLRRLSFHSSSVFPRRLPVTFKAPSVPQPPA